MKIIVQSQIVHLGREPKVSTSTCGSCTEPQSDIFFRSSLSPPQPTMADICCLLVLETAMMGMVP